MSVTERSGLLEPDGSTSDGPPVAIEVRGVDKAFSIPEQRIDTFKEQVAHPFSRPSARRLQALQDVSFEVRRGEFFGIAGRNGSGKSTLLKILASIYRADAGRVRMAGRMAPFIELGVGFNPDRTARENVVLNAVMMGLTPRQARERIDAVFEFAELEGFRELKLKNFSSGMVVRLAFSVMLQAGADIMLIDEVLAVGDASFQQKCADAFHEMKRSGKTVVLVTHDMSAIQAYCDRAMLLHDGKVVELGEPEVIARRYYRMNFEGGDEDSAGSEPMPDVHARVVEAGLEGEEHDEITNVEQGRPIRFHAVIEAQIDLARPRFAFHCTSAEGVHVFGTTMSLRRDRGEPDLLRAGQRVRISGVIDNPLAVGRYFLTCWVYRDRHKGDLAYQAFGLVAFLVYGVEEIPGLVAVDAEIDVVPEAMEDS